MARKNKNAGRQSRSLTRAKGRELARRSPTLNVRKRVLIVCEDSKSSYLYFKRFRSELRLPTVKVEICGPECGPAPINVVDFAKEMKEKIFQDEYDYIFCVIDVDTHTTLPAAIDKADANGMKVILSNPCVEYWYILHFKQMGTPFHTSREVAAYLKKNHIKGYSKGGDKIFDVIYPSTKEAIKNSRAILRQQHHNESDLTKCNPSTHVHLVIECLKKIAKESN